MSEQSLSEQSIALYAGMESARLCVFAEIKRDVVGARRPQVTLVDVTDDFIRLARTIGPTLVGAAEDGRS